MVVMALLIATTRLGLTDIVKAERNEAYDGHDASTPIISGHSYALGQNVAPNLATKRCWLALQRPEDLVLVQIVRCTNLAV